MNELENKVVWIASETINLEKLDSNFINKVEDKYKQIYVSYWFAYW